MKSCHPQPNKFMLPACHGRLNKSHSNSYDDVMDEAATLYKRRLHVIAHSQFWHSSYLQTFRGD